jgi:hypothetical protein
VPKPVLAPKVCDHFFLGLAINLSVAATGPFVCDLQIIGSCHGSFKLPFLASSVLFYQSQNSL